jgi:hypothetical protein
LLLKLKFSHGATSSSAWKPALCSTRTRRSLVAVEAPALSLKMATACYGDGPGVQCSSCTSYPRLWNGSIIYIIKLIKITGKGRLGWRFELHGAQMTGSYVNDFGSLVDHVMFTAQGAGHRSQHPRDRRAIYRKPWFLQSEGGSLTFSLKPIPRYSMWHSYRIYVENNSGTWIQGLAA